MNFLAYLAAVTLSALMFGFAYYGAQQDIHPAIVGLLLAGGATSAGIAANQFRGDR